MPKYIYKPIEERVYEVYKEHTSVDRSGDFPNGLTAELCVTADSEEEALQIRIMISDITAWELFEVID
jgi:hypothetical protein